MRAIATFVTAVVSFSLYGTLQASTYGSVEPLANPAVIDTRPLSEQPLSVREAFATRLLQCGIVSRVVDALSSTGAITTINDLNTHFAVGAGGFAGRTNPAYVYTVIDDGPNAASLADVKVLTDSLGYVLSQASAFLLDADDTSSFDFPANFVVLNFDTPPSLARSAALFKTVGRIDPDCCSGRRRAATRSTVEPISHLQSDVEDPQFIRGLRPCGRGVRSGVHADRQRNAFAVPGRRRLPGQQLVGEHAGRGIPVTNSAAEPPRARPHSCLPSPRHPGRAPQTRAPQPSVA